MVKKKARGKAKAMQLDAKMDSATVDTAFSNVDTAGGGWMVAVPAGEAGDGDEMDTADRPSVSNVEPFNFEEEDLGLRTKRKKKKKKTGHVLGTAGSGMTKKMTRGNRSTSQKKRRALLQEKGMTASDRLLAKQEKKRQQKESRSALKGLY